MKNTGIVAGIAMTVVLLISSCGGGFGQKTGVFIDSTVAGLSYSSPSNSGKTDKDGKFRYKQGETIVFSIGNITLGQALAKEQMTPYDLATQNGEIQQNRLSNIIRLLQTLDSDNTPDNGITLDELVNEKSNDLDASLIDLDANSSDFAESPALLELLASTGNLKGLVPVGQAYLHLAQNVEAAPEHKQFTIGGVAMNIAQQVTLSNFGQDELVINDAGNFIFPTPLPTGVDFDIRVSKQPENALCSIQNGQGVVLESNVDYIVVECASTTPELIGKVSGLEGNLSIISSNKQVFNISSNDTFSLGITYNPDKPITFSIKSHPQNQLCHVENNPHSGVAFDISCSNNIYIIGGEVSGLSGELAIQLNDNVLLNLTENGNFAFPPRFAPGDDYKVSLIKNPTAQSCVIKNNSGSVDASSASTIKISCATSIYTIQATQIGYDKNIDLRNNDLPADKIEGNNYYFNVATGSKYKLAMNIQPAGYRCDIPSGATGTMPEADVKNISVQCKPLPRLLTVHVTGLTSFSEPDVNFPEKGLQIFETAIKQKVIFEKVNDGINYTLSYSNNEDYNLAISNPPGQTCVFDNGTDRLKGNIGVTDLNSVPAICARDTIDINIVTTGFISGSTFNGTFIHTLSKTPYQGTIATETNTSNTSFATSILHGETYSISINQPKGQICSFSQTDSAVTSINKTTAISGTISHPVYCKSRRFNVTGTISGYAQVENINELALDVSGDNDKPAINIIKDSNNNYMYTFPGYFGASYDISIVTPNGQQCTTASTTIGNNRFTILNDSDNTNGETINCINNKYDLTVILTNFSNSENNGSLRFTYAGVEYTINKSSSMQSDTPSTRYITLTDGIEFNQHLVLHSFSDPAGQICFDPDDTGKTTEERDIQTANKTITLACANRLFPLNINVTGFIPPTGTNKNSNITLGVSGTEKLITQNDLYPFYLAHDSAFDIQHAGAAGQNCALTPSLSNGFIDASGLTYNLNCTNITTTLDITSPKLKGNLNIEVFEGTSNVGTPVFSQTISKSSNNTSYNAAEFNKNYTVAISNLPAHQNCTLGVDTTNPVTEKTIYIDANTVNNSVQFPVLCEDKTYALSVQTYNSDTILAGEKITIGNGLLLSNGTEDQITIENNNSPYTFTHRYAFGETVSIEYPNSLSGQTCMLYDGRPGPLFNGSFDFTSDTTLYIHCNYSHTITLDISNIQLNDNNKVNFTLNPSSPLIGESLENPLSDSSTGALVVNPKLDGKSPILFSADRGDYTLDLSGEPLRQECQFIMPDNTVVDNNSMPVSLNSDTVIKVECKDSFTIGGTIYMPLKEVKFEISDSSDATTILHITDISTTPADYIEIPYTLNKKYLKGETANLNIDYLTTGNDIYADASCQFVRANTYTIDSNSPEDILNADVICTSNSETISSSCLVTGSDTNGSGTTSNDEITTMDCSGIDTTSIDEAKIFGNLASITLDNTNTVDMSALRHLPRLTSVNYSYPSTTSSLISDYTNPNNPAISDNILKNCINNNALLSNWTRIEQITELNCSHYSGNTRITDLNGIHLLHNLQTLVLDNQEVGNLDPLTTLYHTQQVQTEYTASGTPTVKTSPLTTLIVNNNQFPLTDKKNIHSLAEVKSLTRLSIEKNALSDITGLAGLTSLHYLSLRNNNIDELRKPVDRLYSTVYTNNIGYINLTGQTNNALLTARYQSVLTQIESFNSGKPPEQQKTTPKSPFPTTTENPTNTVKKIYANTAAIIDNDNLIDILTIEGTAPAANTATIRLRLKHASFTDLRVYVRTPGDNADTKIFDIDGRGQITPSAETTASATSDPLAVQTISEQISFTNWEGQWEIRVRDSVGGNTPGELLSWEIIP